MKKKRLEIKDKLIISIDVSKKNDVISLCKRINNKVTTLKLGLEVIYSTGFNIVETVKSFGYKILLDLKLLDIPNTVTRAINSIYKLNIDMVTIHVLGGKEMLSVARNKLQELSERNKELPPLMFGVTILTSLGSVDLRGMGFKDGYLSTVLNLAGVAIDSGIEGIICSPNEVRDIREKFGNNFYIATPGIRLKSDSTGDQKRINTPGNAVLNGSDFIIVGRSITGKDNIEKIIEIYLNEISKALKSNESYKSN
jgi:orotidine-5'-phosphate decarboxylase